MGMWTKEELLEHAERHGFPLKERTFNDWVQRGLIANAERRGRGPGAGVASVWREEQADLLIKLLELRQQTNRIATLASLPVGLWLYFGDQYVDTRQAMKAMRTWAEGHQSVSARSAEGPVRALIEQIAGPDIDPRIRNRLIKEVQFFAPEPALAFDRQEFVSRLQAVMDEAPRSFPMNAEGLAFLIESRLWAIQNIDEFKRADFEAARAAVLATLAEYQAEFGVGLPDAGLNHRLVQSPLDLVSYFGMRKLNEESEQTKDDEEDK